jgi:hypothetical protein
VASYSAHCLYWPRTSSEIHAYQREVLAHFKIAINYTAQEEQHGAWMDRIMAMSRTDLVIFIDVDCIPVYSDTVEKVLRLALHNQTFAGPAQATNCIANSAHIFAAPSMLAVCRSYWEAVGRPSFQPFDRGDVAQRLSLIADERRSAYTALFPLAYEREPQEGIWRLGNYGHYGIGTFYAGGIYHLFQGRLTDNISLFRERCRNVIDGNLRYESFHRCTPY